MAKSGKPWTVDESYQGMVIATLYGYVEAAQRLGRSRAGIASMLAGHGFQARIAAGLLCGSKREAVERAIANRAPWADVAAMIGAPTVRVIERRPDAEFAALVRRVSEAGGYWLQVADEWGCTEPAARQRGARLGLTIRGNGIQLARRREAFEAIVRRVAEEGGGWADVARLAGVEPQTARVRGMRAGIRLKDWQAGGQAKEGKNGNRTAVD